MKDDVEAKATALSEGSVVCPEDDLQKIEFIVFVSKECTIQNSSDRKSKEAKSNHIEPTLITDKMSISISRSIIKSVIKKSW